MVADAMVSLDFPILVSLTMLVTAFEFAWTVPKLMVARRGTGCFSPLELWWLPAMAYGR